MINIVILVIIIFLLLILSMVWPPDSPWAPWWRTNKKTARAICKIANITSKDVVYDLGCGDAEVLIQSAKLGAKCVGIEIDLLRVLIARLRISRNNLQNKIIIKRNNFFKEDVSSASVIIVYLVPVTLNKLLPKFKKELKKGTQIVSFRYEMKMPLKKEDRKNKLYLYTI
jgi:16S rRNA A1518/A1519 N6-dimethyltransferase RsmA/KsgA/DIM1 with predicted DNA glycosylase/AP lyase activity